MADVSQLALTTAVSVAINTTWAVKNGREPATPMIAGAVSFVSLSVLGQLWRWDIVNAIAILFLLSAVIRHGLPLGQDLAALANGGSKKKSGFSGGGGSF